MRPLLGRIERRELEFCNIRTLTMKNAVANRAVAYLRLGEGAEVIVLVTLAVVLVLEVGFVPGETDWEMTRSRNRIKSSLNL